MLQVDGLDSSDPLSIVKNLDLLEVKFTWLDQSIEHNVSIEVDNADSSQPFSLVRLNSLTVKSKYLCLPEINV